MKITFRSEKMSFKQSKCKHMFCRITDLQVSVDVQTLVVTLTWTAPGDNLNEGEGKKILFMKTF